MGGKPGGFNKKNPKDKTGQVMRCNICQSDEHLWRKCPKKPPDGQFVTAPASGSVAGRPQQQLALATTAANPFMNWNSPNMSSLPGVHFFETEMENLRSVSQAASTVSSSRKRNTVDVVDETPRSSVRRSPPAWSPGSQADAEFTTPASHSPSAFDRSVEQLLPGSGEPSSPPPERPAPSFATSHATVNVDHHDAGCSSGAIRENKMNDSRHIRDQSVHGLHSILLGLGNAPTVFASSAIQQQPPNEVIRARQVINLESQVIGAFPNANAMIFMPNNMFPQHGMHAAASPTTVSPGSVQTDQPVTGAMPHDGGAPSASSASPSFPWWEVDNSKMDGSNTMPSSAYHLRTRRHDGSVGLLIDPGAHDNLVGSRTVEQMCDELNADLIPRSLDRPLPVEGVGKTAQVADKNAHCFYLVVSGYLVPSAAGSTAARMLSCVLFEFHCEILSRCLTGGPTLMAVGILIFDGSWAKFALMELRLANDFYILTSLTSQAQRSLKKKDTMLKCIEYIVGCFYKRYHI